MANVNHVIICNYRLRKPSYYLFAYAGTCGGLTVWYSRPSLSQLLQQWGRAKTNVSQSIHTLDTLFVD